MSKEITTPEVVDSSAKTPEDVFITLKKLQQPQTLNDLISNWHQISQRAKNNAKKNAEAEDYSAALENIWIACGIEGCCDWLTAFIDSGKASLEVPITEEERKILIERAGKESIETYVRKRLGL